MFVRFIQKIRQKPKAVRDQYAFWIAVVSAGLVALVWFIGLRDGYIQESVQGNGSDSQTDSLGDLMSDFKDQVSSIREVVDELEVDSDETSASSATTATTTYDLQSQPAASTSTNNLQSTTQRPVRIATTSSQSEN